MMILTRSRRIRRALRTVRTRIPAKNWQVIASFLVRIRADSGWGFWGLMGRLDRSGGKLLPLYKAVVPISDQKNPRGQVCFNLPVCRLYSDRALVGLVAHELAHALRAAEFGSGWYEKMDCRYPAEERIADAIVSRWGLDSHIRRMRHERKMHLTPLLNHREPKIMQLLSRHAPEAVKSARERLKVSRIVGAT